MMIRRFPFKPFLRSASLLLLPAFCLLFAACGDDGKDEIQADGDEFPKGPIFMNEVDCHGRDWVEIGNRSDEDVDLGGWIFSDSLTDASHFYTIPAGSVVKPDGYLAVKQLKDTEAGFSFGIKCGKDTVYLLDANKDVKDKTALGEVAEGFTWGRLPNYTGSWQVTEPSQGEKNKEPEDLAEVLFDPLAVATVTITLSEQAKTSLVASPYDYVQGDVTVTTKDGANGPATVGVRLKSGYSFQPLDKKASFKIKFNEVNSSLRVLGLKDIILNSMVDDASMMHETVAYRLFREAGLPAPRTGYAWVKLNDQDYGLYVIIEKYDDVFASRNYNSTQHIYEGSADLYTEKLAKFEADEGDETDTQDLQGLIDAAGKTAQNGWYDAVSAVSDIGEFAAFFAMEHYVGHRDGYSLAANNFFLHSTDKGKFTLLPWGTDRTFAEKPAFYECSSLLCTRCMEVNDCKTLYGQALDDITSKTEDLGLESWISQIQTVVQSYVEKDTKKSCTNEEQLQAVQSLKTYLAGRNAEAVGK